MSGRRVTIVASELLGRAGTGGAGTADSLLAVALGRHEHRVCLLVATGRDIGELDAGWRDTYASSGVEVRILQQLEGVTPAFMRPSLEVLNALREDPPDVVVLDDWRALGFLAQRARQVGLALDETAFVVHCHGSARVLAEFARKVPDTVARFGEQVMERASVALADAVVSPSQWLLDWMRAHEWPVPRAPQVIPYLRESAALDESHASPRAPRSPIRRLAFFGQLREGKGIRIYLEALNSLEPALLDGLELVFLGRESKRWTAETIANALPRSAGIASRVRFETSLDRERALEELRRPGTLALMPSLLDNSPNTVSECIDHDIPFLATRTGGIPELVAPEDRARVLCDPTAEALASALGGVLGSKDGLAPARAAHDPEDSLRAWLELIDGVVPARQSSPEAPEAIDVVTTSDASEAVARTLVERTSAAPAQVVRAGSRRAGVERSSSEWLVFLDDDDEPDDVLLDRLVAAQQASGADAVTCAVRPDRSAEVVRLFLGDPGAFGLVENQYGVLGLVRSSLVSPDWPLDGAVDPDWVLFARLALAGAHIVSTPEPLAAHRGQPGRGSDVPGEGLAVLEAFEEAHAMRDLPELTATLAAALDRTDRDHERPPTAEGLRRRGLRVLREEGPRAVLRRVRRRFVQNHRVEPMP